MLVSDGCCDPCNQARETCSLASESPPAAKVTDGPDVEHLSGSRQWASERQETHCGRVPRLQAEYARVRPSTPEYARVRPSTPEYARVRPSTPEYAGVRPSTPEYARVRPSTPEYARVRPSTPECARVRPSTPEYARVRPSMPEYARVRLSHARSYPVIPGHTRSYPVIPGHTRAYPVIPGHTRSYPVIPGHTRSYPGIPGHTRSYPVIPGHTRSYPVIPGHTRSYPGIPGHTRSYPVIPSRGFPQSRFPVTVKKHPQVLVGPSLGNVSSEKHAVCSCNTQQQPCSARARSMRRLVKRSNKKHTVGLEELVFGKLRNEGAGSASVDISRGMELKTDYKLTTQLHQHACIQSLETWHITQTTACIRITASSWACRNCHHMMLQ